jgi:hypothetical protein
MLVATYDSNFVQSKEGAGKGKTFHRYTITGSKEELKEYTNSPQFKAYPRTHPVTGQPQLVTMYMDALKDELPLYKKQDGNFTLDGSETRKDLARASALDAVSPSLGAKFAERLVDKVAGKLNNATIASISEEIVEEEKNIDEM